MEETLLAGLPALGLTLTPAQVDTLCRFGRALLEKNRVMNLTAITEPAEVARLHFLDSLALLGSAELAGKTVVDVGCGAGFPGVPLKIAEPAMELTLLDSLGKRIAWLAEVLPALGVAAECVAARAEEFAADRRERYDVAVSRAVARLNVLCELCLPLVKPGGLFLAMKGAAAEEEAAEAAQAVALLGGRVERIDQYALGDAAHRVVVVRKERPTPRRYPRRYANIKRQPL